MPTAAAMMDPAPAAANPRLRRTLTATRIVSSSLLQLNAAGQQIARQGVAVAEVDVVERRGGGRGGLFHDQERDRQAVADPEPGNGHSASRIIESHGLDLGGVKVLARALILHLLAVLVVVLAGVFVRLEVRLSALRTGESPAGVCLVATAAAATPASSTAPPPPTPAAAPPTARRREDTPPASRAPPHKHQLWGVGGGFDFC